MPLGNVLVLSDSDGGESDVVAAPPPVVKSKRKRRKVKEDVAAEQQTPDPKGSLRAILGTKCMCKRCNCFQKFVADSDFKQLLEYRTHFFSLHKLDQDHFVPDLCLAVVLCYAKDFLKRFSNAALSCLCLYS